MCLLFLNCPYFSLQDEGELEQLMKLDNATREVVREMRQKVDEAKSSLSSNRSRGKVLDALMQQKKSGRISGILGRLVKKNVIVRYKLVYGHFAMMCKTLSFTLFTSFYNSCIITKCCTCRETLEP